MWTELSATAATFLFAGFASLNWIQEEAWGRWGGGFLVSIVFTEKLSPCLPLCLCVCVAGGMCPFPGSQGRSSRVPKLSFLYFEL